MDEEFIILDKIKWHILHVASPDGAMPLCPKHHLQLELAFNNERACLLECPECDEKYPIEREYSSEKNYVINKINSKLYKGVKFINLDDEAIPIAEEKISSKDSKYFVKALLTESKVGQRLVVYAGEKGRKEKTQIFVEPEIRRLAFDQSNTHPAEVFLTLEATFNDGTKMSIKNSNLKK